MSRSSGQGRGEFEDSIFEATVKANGLQSHGQWS